MKKEEIANSRWQAFRPEDLDNLHENTTVQDMNTSMLQNNDPQKAALKCYSIETLLSLKDHYKDIPHSNSDELGVLASRLIKSYSPIRHAQIRVHAPEDDRSQTQFKHITHQDRLNVNITSLSKHASWSQN